MPEVPDYNLKPLKSIYVPKKLDEPASLKQRSLIATLHERHKLKVPDLSKITKGEASILISRMLN